MVMYVQSRTLKPHVASDTFFFNLEKINADLKMSKVNFIYFIQFIRESRC